MDRGRRISGATFSLVEMVIAVVVLAMMAGVLTPAFEKSLNDSRIARATVQCRRICAALAAYHDDRGEFPPGLQGDPNDNFAESISCGFGAEILNTWLYDGPTKYLTAPIGRDPWGTAYNYRVFSKRGDYGHVVVFSNGPDRVCESWDEVALRDTTFKEDDFGASIDVHR